MRILDYLLALIALGGLAALGWWGINLSPQGAQPLQSTLQTETQAALKTAGIEWASVEMQGQRAIITGEAPSQDALREAADIILTSTGKGGLIFGGVTVIESRATMAPPVSPFVWIATKTEDERIILSGYVPGTAIRQAILADAEKIAPGRVEDRMSLATGAGEGNWQGVARLGLEQLGLLDGGEARLTDYVLSVRGVAMDDAIRAQVSAAVANVAAPYKGDPDIKGASLWAARLGAGSLVLTGKVASEQERREILNIAGDYYSGKVRDEMIVNTLDYQGWMDGVRLGLPHFAKFKTGQMGFDPEGEGFTFSGEASGSTLQYLKEDMAKLTGPYGVDIKAGSVAVEVAEIAGIDFSNDPVAACQAAFDSVLQTNKVYFASGNAVITRQSGETLDKLMAVSQKCAPDLRFELDGHTDNSGSREFNVSLSEARAQAVANYMAAAGFDAARLVAVGYGPDDPVADNSTSEGMARNRRIEFKILERSE